MEEPYSNGSQTFVVKEKFFSCYGFEPIYLRSGEQGDHPPGGGAEGGLAGQR